MDLREYLENRGERQTQFAIRAGIAPSTMTRYLKHGGKLDTETIRKIKMATEGSVGFDDLIKNGNEPGNGHHE